MLNQTILLKLQHTNSTTNATDAPEMTTHFFENEEQKSVRRLFYDVIASADGGLAFLFNLFILGSYYSSLRAGRLSFTNRVSFMMLVLSWFCMIHGIVFGVFYTMQRNLKYELSEGVCVFTTLLIDLCDHFILALLPVVAIEKLIIVYRPQISKSRLRSILLAILAPVFIISALCSWLPLLIDSSSRSYHTKSPNYQERLSRFDKAYTCNGILNKKNKNAPDVLLALQSIGVVATLAILMITQYRIRSHFNQDTTLPSDVKKTLRRSARNIRILAALLIIINIPFGLVEVIRNNCHWFDEENRNDCSAWLLEMRFIFRIIFHSGNIFAPMVFFFSDPKIRQNLLRCRKPHNKTYVKDTLISGAVIQVDEAAFCPSIGNSTEMVPMVDSQDSV